MNQKSRWLLIFLFASLVGKAQPYPYAFHNEWIDYSKTYYKFKVMGFGLDANSLPIRKGIVRIPYSSLAAVGLGSTQAEHFQLWRDGEEVAIYVSAPSGPLGSSDYIEFPGEINNGKLDNELYRDPDFQLADKWSLQTDTAAYFITANTASGNKRLTPTNNNVAGNSLSATEYFMCTMGRYYRSGDISNGFSASLGKNLYSSSYDRGEGWVSRAVRPVAGCGSATLPQTFTDLYPYIGGPQMTVRVNCVGDGQNSRNVKILVNGDSITTFQMDYINYAKVEEYVDASKISSGTGLFQVVNLSPSACDQMRVSLIEFTYPRQFNLSNASYFEMQLPSSPDGRYLKIANFNSGGVPPVLYDLTNGTRYEGDMSIPDTLQFALESSSTAYKLVLTTQAGNYYVNGVNLQQRNFTNFDLTAKQGNYLIISNPLIYGSGATNYVDQYKAYRTSQQGGSYNAKVIDINDLVDQFAWGIKKHPLSIKNFIRYARYHFADSVKFVFLIGKGVIYNEYRANESDPLADQLNLVPTWGNPASDNLLAADNISAVPALPIGRLSAVTPQEVGDYLLKVKQHEASQSDTTQTIAAKAWMKNVIQIAGANDVALGNQLDGYLQNYKAMIADTSFGANVIDFNKTADPAGYPAAVNSFKNIYEHGAALITYFGHSSETSLDFSLENPQNYNNPEKYPMFIANGCSAGNHFLFEANRFNSKSTISEKFILSPQRGAIGYLASTHYGVVNYLNLYTQNFYKALGETKYDKSIGEVIKEAVATTLNLTGPYDYYSRVHSEQYALHGDPAIKVHASALPDYAVEAGQINVSPSFISVADSSFSVKVKIYNLGKATNESVDFKIVRQKPNGDLVTIISQLMPHINYLDSVTVNIPIAGNLDKGINKIFATVDFSNSITELTDFNNSAVLEVLISDEEVRPVYPYKYAIINNAAQKLYASTVDPLSNSKVYLMEMDTTALFNSPSKISKTDTSTGGVLEYVPGLTYEDGTTYYWRVAPYASSDIHWINSSFVYKANSGPGFQQGHLYQHLQSNLQQLILDSSSRKYSYTDKLHNLFIVNSIYPSSGTEDEHFSISVDGSSIIESACVGASVIINVFDSLTFQPWKNLTQPFGAGAVCAPGREYNFEYAYTSAATRKNAMDFLDAIPPGYFVTVRLVLDQPYTTFAANWAADTSLYGSGNSLYHRLKNSGFTDLDSFYFPRTWAFAFKKGDPSFAPSYILSDGLYDRINLSVNCITPNTEGEISSPIFGPSNQWDSVIWKGYKLETGHDLAKVKVYGVQSDGNESLLYTLDTSQQNFSIATVSAIQYPFIRLKMQNIDTLTATPYQLTEWSLQYHPVPEGAIAPNLYKFMPDTVGNQSSNNPDPYVLSFGVAFKNISTSNFNSLALKVMLIDSAGNFISVPVNRLASLAAGDTLHIDLSIDVSSITGWYYLYLEVNPDNDQPEQNKFNNFLYKKIFFDKGTTLSIGQLNFMAQLMGSSVKSNWIISGEDISKEYEVQHSVNNTEYVGIGTIIGHAGINNNYTLYDYKPMIGKNYYRLKITLKDGSIHYSPVRLITVSKDMPISVYPNPVRDILNINIGRGEGKSVNVKLINAYGQVVWSKNCYGLHQIDMRPYSSGMYLVQIDSGNKTIKIQKQ